MPAARLVAPEPCLPLQRLLLNCSQTDQDEPERRRLDENSTDQAEARQGFRSTQPGREGGAQLDALRAPNRVREMEVAASAENDRHHQAQTEKREILQLEELRKGGVHGDGGLGEAVYIREGVKAAALC